MSCDASTFLNMLQAEAARTADPEELGALVVRAVKNAMPHASWVGIYWLRGEELVLGPFEGEETQHTRIPVGKGVCGTAIAQDADQRIGDVRAVDNYLACSAAVRSELVVLIRSHGGVVGQIDLDAEAVDAFSEDDHCILRAVADALGAVVEQPRAPVGDDLATE